MYSVHLHTIGIAYGIQDLYIYTYIHTYSIDMLINVNMAAVNVQVSLILIHKTIAPHTTQFNKLSE